MKSERRHELQHNELADWLAKTGDDIKPYQNYILLGVVAVVVVVVGYTLWSRSAAATTTKAWTELGAAMQSGDTDALAQVIKAYPNTNVAYVGSVVAADLHLAKGCDQRFKSKSAAQQELSSAIALYDTVLKQCRTQSLLARATYGMARAKETQCDRDAAKKLYEEVVAKWPEGTYASATQEHLQELAQRETGQILDKLKDPNFSPTPSFTSPSDSMMQPGFESISEPAEGSAVIPDTKPAAKADDKKPAAKSDAVKPAAKAEEKKPEKAADTKK
jgi:hypothetical protein